MKLLLFGFDFFTSEKYIFSFNFERLFFDFLKAAIGRDRETKVDFLANLVHNSKSAANFKFKFKPPTLS